MAFGLGLVHCAHIGGDSSTHQGRVPMDLPLLHCWLCNSVLPASGQGNRQELQSFNAGQMLLHAAAAKHDSCVHAVFARKSINNAGVFDLSCAVPC
eukprot:6333488-Amphidinium_carterae.1